MSRAQEVIAEQRRIAEAYRGPLQDVIALEHLARTHGALLAACKAAVDVLVFVSPSPVPAEALRLLRAAISDAEKAP